MVADIYNIVNGWISLLWIYKVQIVGALFLALTIFEYFYRIYLRPIRQKQINEIKNIFIELKKELSVMKDMTKDELEHELLANNIKHLSNKIDSNNELLSTKISSNHEIIITQINTNQRVLLTQHNAEAEVLNIRFDESDKKIGNALVKIGLLEKDTDFIRAFKRYRIIAGMALIGLISVTNFKQIQEWLKGLLPWNQ